MGGSQVATKRADLIRRRRAVGLSQEALAAALGVDRSTVVRWEAGDTDPQPWVRPQLARRLGISIESLAKLLHDIQAGDEHRQRTQATRQEPEKITLLTISTLRRQLQQAQIEYDVSPSAGLLAAASQYHAQISYLAQQVQDKHLCRELLSLEVRSSTFMGQVIWDVSQRRDHITSCAYFERAIHTARRIDDRAGEAYATLRKSYLALYGEKAPHIGLRHAQAAAHIGSPCSPALTGLSLLHVAEAHAMLQQRHDCERTLDNARMQLDRVNGTEDSNHLTQAEIERMAGSCYLFLDLPATAQPVLHRASRSLENKKKPQSIVLGNLTLALIRQGELEAAAQALHHTIDALESSRGGGGLNIAFQAGRELKRWRNEPAVHELHDRLFTLMSSS